MHWPFPSLSAVLSANLKAINTFFALTIATYYIGVHHTPPLFFHKIHFKFYTAQGGIETEKAASFSPSLLMNYPGSQTAHVLASTQGDNVPRGTFSRSSHFLWELETPGQESSQNGSPILNSRPPGSDIPPPHGSLQGSIEEQKIRLSQTLSSPEARILELYAASKNKKMHSINSPFSIVNNLTQNGSSTPSQIVPRGTIFFPEKIGIPLGYASRESSTEFRDGGPRARVFSSPTPSLSQPVYALEIRDGSVQQQIDLPSIPYYGSESPVGMPDEGILQSQVPLVEEKTKPAENAHFYSVFAMHSAPQAEKPTEFPLPKEDVLKPWYTYIDGDSLNSQREFLIPLLKKIAPESLEGIDPSEAPFRLAFLQTLLDPKFQPYLDLSWWRPHNKRRRLEFFYTYLKAYIENVDWSDTDFKYLSHGMPKDPHNLPPEVFDTAYAFPRKLCRLIYMDEDFDCLSKKQGL